MKTIASTTSASPLVMQWAHSPGVPQPTPDIPPVPPEISPDIDEPEFPDTPKPPVQDPPPQPQPVIGLH